MNEKKKKWICYGIILIVATLMCYPLFMGTWVIINVKCLFKRETTWEKINHVRDIKIAEVKEVPEKI